MSIWTTSLAWTSYQIRKIAGCACARNAGNVFPRRRFQSKPLVSDPGMHHGTCVTHVPWCMSGSLTCGDGENVPGIPGACAPAILRIWQEAHVWHKLGHHCICRCPRTDKVLNKNSCVCYVLIILRYHWFWTPFVLLMTLFKMADLGIWINTLGKNCLGVFRVVITLLSIIAWIWYTLMSDNQHISYPMTVSN